MAQGETNHSKTEHTAEKRISDHLANERTYLAWLRTGVGVIVFGFAIGRFALALQQLGKLGGGTVKSTGVSLDMGMASMVFGVGMIVAGLVRYHQNRRRIDENTFRPATTLATVIGVLIVLFGLVLTAYLGFTHNSLLQ